MKVFPNREKDYTNNKNISNEIFGSRFHIDQSLYEYLIEFLLIFASPKKVRNDECVGKLRFHQKDEEFEYYAETMIGLRRFIFYDASKKDKSIKLDEEAYRQLIESLKDKMLLANANDYDKYILAIQDLFRGFAVVLKNRTWCAQQILPICPELIFCGANPNQKERRKITKWNDTQIDSKFDFTKRNFLARGGEIYYLHILRVLYSDEDDKRISKLNYLLMDLLTNQSAKISKIARFIQDIWYEQLTVNKEDKQLFIDKNDKKKLYQKYSLGYIPELIYEDCGNKTIDELISFLSSDFQQIKKIDILAKGIVFQIMRMMYHAVCYRLQIKRKPWIMDMTNNTSKTIKQITTKNYKDIENDFITCMYNTAKEMKYQGDESIIRIRDGLKDSFDIFRARGKEMRCIIPISGAFERFTLSEDLVRFIVLSLVEPEEKITYDIFLERLYKNYGIVIGATQYEKAFETLNVDQLAIKNCMFENQKCFQDFLRSTGFLKELSDSTSIVYNPYINII